MQIKELGHVVLYVTDLKKMSDFYGKTLGFKKIAGQDGIAVFGSGRTHHELLLIEIGGQPKAVGEVRPGLYHIGFKVAESREELRAVFKELKEKGVQIIGTSDHTVTESIYIADPDGNELELYADVDMRWQDDPELILSPIQPLDLN